MTILTATLDLAPLNAFAAVWGNRSARRQVGDLTEEFRVQAAECRELANRWGGEGERQYEALARQWQQLADLTERRRYPAISP